MKLAALPKTIFCLALVMCWGNFAPPTAAQSNEWVFVAVSAQRQTVVVQTPRESYTANFENAALVYPNGRASGVLELAQRDGALRRFRVFAGRVQFDDGTVTGVLLRARDACAGDNPRDEITIIIHPEAVLPEDCLIYTTLGTQATWEAEGRIAVFRD